MSRTFNTSLCNRVIKSLEAGIVPVMSDGPARRHIKPAVTAIAEGQNRNGARLACVLRPSDVSRLDHPHTIPQVQINASTPKTIISSWTVGLEAASISAWNSAHD